MESPTLADWVGDVKSFTSHQWQREPAVFTPQTLASPFDLDELDAAFDSGLLRTPYLEMVRSNKVTVPADAYTTSRVVNGTTHHGFADRAKVVALLRAGATLLLRHVDQWHRPTGDLVTRLSGELDRRVEAFFFVTPADGQGLAIHRDDADVFALQVAGRKTWYVHGAPTTADWSLGELPDDEHSPQLLHSVLEPGNVLYIPRGFAHRAVGEAGLSAHLSLTIRDLSLQDLRTALERCLTDGLDVPARPLGEAAIADACATLLSHVRAKLATVEPGDLRLAARAAQARQQVQATRAETFAGTARDWEAGALGAKRAGLASVVRTWRRLRDAARTAD
ncbi:cupin domain-containing protein [Streptomyces sp. NBC_01260]|uniref:JmjC domain-containing protein n=1 Tax=unclassified Streptomyces TaxID=2593676 RepID=UPI000FBC40A6|nr:MULTISPECIES: cupin domain-containing protein [unclassified Streptomyces]MCX4768786.1 cupin domain-containing protein [Streptomyces sp. NBC_01285]ROQ77080.1 cupin superfamily protein [Streptomyces sp. CEV 2-1]